MRPWHTDVRHLALFNRVYSVLHLYIIGLKNVCEAQQMIFASLAAKAISRYLFP